jgi:hypothetical protein
MHTKYLTLIAATAFAMSSLGCQDEATGPAGGGAPSFSAETSTENVERVLAATKFVPCANGGLGEDVSLSGSFHDKFHVTLDGSGGAHVEVVHNPQGVSGTGLTTGAKYVGVGASPQDESNVNVGEEHTTVTNMRIIGQGPGNDLLIHTDFHSTVLANGVVTSFHDDVRIECK